MYKLCHETGNTLKGTIYLETEILPRLKCPGVEGGVQEMLFEENMGTIQAHHHLNVLVELSDPLLGHGVTLKML